MLNKIKTLKKPLIIILVLATLFVVGKNIFSPKHSANKEAETKHFSEPVAKNVILYIGDGMGPEAMGLLMQYARYAQNSKYIEKQSVLEKFMNDSAQGLVLNNIHNGIVTDSAAAITQMTSGEISSAGYIGMNYKKQPVKTVLVKAKENGKAVGIVCDSELIDATPSGLVAHNLNRYDKDNIAEDMINSNVDVMLSGGLAYFISKKQKGSKRTDNKDLVALAHKKGYDIVYDKKGLRNSRSGKILGLFSNKYMPYAIDKYERENLYVPDLSSMALKALRVLSKKEDGFFLMVEAAKLDWALHMQDAGATMHEMLAFDETLAFLYKYAYNHPDTLLIVTADHDTGGFGFEYNKDKSEKQVIAIDGSKAKMGYKNFASYENLDRLYGQKTLWQNFQKEFESFPKDQQNLSNFTALFNNMFAMFLDKQELKQIFETRDYKAAKTLLDAKRNVVWATNNHISTPVNVIAYGAGREYFKGVYHNTKIATKISVILGLE